MAFYIVLFSFMTIIYFIVSYKKQNLINIVFFSYVSDGLIMIFLYTLGLIINNTKDIRKGDLIIIIFYFLKYILLYLIESNYFHIPNTKKIIFPSKINKKIYLILVLFVIAFFMVNFKILREAVSNPRMFYANSRIGGGFIYYILIPVIVFVFFVSLCNINMDSSTDIILSLAFMMLFGLIIYIFGQKGTILTMALIYFSVYSYKTKIINKNKNLIKIGVVFAFVFAIVFVSYSLQQNINENGIIKGMVSYADYLNNFNDLVDELKTFSYGKVSIEDEIFGYIPRAIWSDKPQLYGSLALGLNVPRLVEWTKALTGAPSFGPLGTLYADFGILCIPIALIKTYIFTIFAKKYEMKLENKFNPFDMLLYFTFVGVSIFYITLVTIPLYQLFVIYIVYRLSKRKNTYSDSSIV